MEFISLFKDIAFFLGGIGSLVIFRYLGREPYYAINFFFMARFVLRFFMHGAQVRYQVATSIALIAFCILAVKLCQTNEKSDNISNIPAFRGILTVLFAVVPIEVINGILNGYNFFHIGVDIYKVVEIIIFFFFIQFTWRNIRAAEQSYRLLVTEMCFIGIIEMFTTERGGTGLNMIMSFFPIFYALGFVDLKKTYWMVCIISMAVVVFSQTRTYLIGLLGGITIICFISRGDLKNIIVKRSIWIGAIAVAFVFILSTIFHSNTSDIVLSRFSELFNEGFDGAGGYRIYEIRRALEKFYESPILGQGYGYLEYLYIELMGYFNWGDFMHNTYVEILCKTGIYGCLIYGIGILLYFKYLFNIRNDCLNNGWSKAAAIINGGIGGTVSWLIIYGAAPLSSYGYIFLPGIISIVYYHLHVNEFECEYVND